MRLADCDETYSDAILTILNRAITTSTAVYDYQPRTAEIMAAWFESKRQGGYPVIGALTESGDLMGFASYGKFRPWPAYKYTVEHSLYVAEHYRGLGVGKQLLAETITTLSSGLPHFVGAIDSKHGQHPATRVTRL
ncbi:MAG: N-acetyltransferase family protein [Phycisphaerales bacterium]